MLDEVVREAARRFGERTAWIGPGGSFTYAQLDARSDAVAGGLSAAGVRPGDRVALTRASDADYLVAVVAIAKVGGVAAGINPSLAPAERAALIDAADPIVVLGRDEELPTGPAPAPLEPDPDRVASIVFTSGTTGTPKGAVFTNRQIDAVRRIDLGPAADQWGAGGPLLAATQFAHIGITTKLPWYLRQGSTLVGLGKWRADDVLEAVAAHRIPSIGGVAPQIALLLRSTRFDDLDLSCVTTLIVGGAFSPPALVVAARQRFGAAYSIRYSSTESGGTGLGTAFDADDDEALHSIGRPRPGVEARVIDPTTGAGVPNGEVGELCLRTPSQMVGYWRNDEATASTIVDGWIRTGDLALIDGRGLVRLRGRIKEQYVRGGYNIAPAEVEAALSDHPAVLELAIAPRPDEVMGEVGVVIVVPADPTRPPSLDELRAHGATRVAGWKLPEALVVVDALPLTPMLKIDRNRLADLARGPAQ